MLHFAFTKPGHVAYGRAKSLDNPSNTCKMSGCWEKKSATAKLLQDFSGKSRTHSAEGVLHPGAAVMDGALLLIAANESCPQPQTSEHLAAVEIMRLQHIIILQNKIDLINESTAANQHDDIQVGARSPPTSGFGQVSVTTSHENCDARCCHSLSAC